MIDVGIVMILVTDVNAAHVHIFQHARTDGHHVLLMKVHQFFMVVFISLTVLPVWVLVITTLSLPTEGELSEVV